jgi:hypothetical protein
MQICVGRFAVLQNIGSWNIRYHNLRVLTLWVLQCLHSATVAVFRQISVANYCVPLNPKPNGPDKTKGYADIRQLASDKERVWLCVCYVRTSLRYEGLFPICQCAYLLSVRVMC